MLDCGKLFTEAEVGLEQRGGLTAKSKEDDTAHLLFSYSTLRQSGEVLRAGQEVHQ